MLAVRPGGRGRGGRRCRARRPLRRRGRRQPARVRRRPRRPVRRAACVPAAVGCRWRTPLGAWLLDEAGFAGTRVGVGPADLGRAGRATCPARWPCSRWGTARRGARVKAPGYLDDAAGPFDAAVAARAGRRGRRRARRRSTRRRGSGCSPPACRPGGRSARRSPAGRSPPGCSSTRPLRCRLPRRRLGRRVTPRRWWPSSGPPRPARPRSPWRWPTGSAARWSTPTPCSSTAAWTSAPPSPTSPSADGVPHHLLDLWHVREAASVAEYRDRARAEIDRLRAAGVVPLLVGGSGLYVRAVLDELDFPGTDAALRARLEAELADVGAAALHDRLAARRPGRRRGGAAQQRPPHRPRARGDRADRRTVPRAAARAAAALPGRRRRPRPRRRPSSTSGSRARVDRMWAAGFVDEVAALAADGLREGPTASRALGYAQVLAQFDGTLTPEEARERTVAHDPAVRAPPAVVVPPRRGDHLVRRGAARPRRRRPGA